MIDRKLILLKACTEYIAQIDELDAQVFYDGTWCDGHCLIEDIKAELDYRNEKP